MAEGALFGLAGKVLGLLGSLVVQEVKLASGVKTEIENLKGTVSRIQSVLRDAEEQSSHSHQIKDWLSKLEDVLHDADDLLDDISTQVLRQKVENEVSLFFSSSNQLAFSVKMGHELKAIRRRLNAIDDDRKKFNLNENRKEPQVMNWGRETYSFVLDDEVIGREDDKKEIIKRLFDDNVVENISIIPIVGFGGLGKTTLAQLVYNDENVKRNFEPKLWICISDIFDVKRIVKEILEQLAKTKHEESLEREILEQLKGLKHEESLEILQSQLRKELNEKKYLIVLDDLWNEDNNKWLLLRNLLMVGARGSRILVTTRFSKIAEIIGTTSHHELKGLDPKKAWSLFVKMAFKEGKEPENQTLVTLGKQIVGKCFGVPLAIRTIGSLLYGKTSKIEWQYFLDDELSQLTQQENSISLTLKLSYDHLPPHLKQCFAYCRLFPKDYRIDVNTLIDLWIAQGFIVLEGPRQRFVDIGRKYFMELLWRSFFQDVETEYLLGNIESCKMHDLMHDLAILVSGTESAILNSSGENVIEKVRHVSFDLVDSPSQFSILVANKRKIRIVLAASVGGKLGNLTCDALISNLNYLRTLDLSYSRLHVVPHSIGELSHLRYLDLSSNSIEFLPNSITKLLNLLTLKLCFCDSLKELPLGIKKLVNLRHLDIRECNNLTHMPLGLGHLTSLEILTWFVVRQGGSKARSGGGLSELKELSNLGGSLVIFYLGHGEDDMVECKATNMKQKKHLQELRLWWDEKWDDGETECYDDMSLEGLQPHPNLKGLKLIYYMGVRIPSWISSITNLVHFHLFFNKRLQHLPPLNQLPFLKSIWLYKLDALEYIWIDEESVSNVLGDSSSSSSSSSITPFFPSLSYLSIEDCPKLKGWWRNSDNEPHHLLLPSFPHSLLELGIEECPNLTSMPPFPYLKDSLHLSGCSWKVLEQTMKMKMKMKMGAATTSTYFPLSQLQKLILANINELESLPAEGLRNLVSLQELSVNRCDELVSLPWIGILTSLQTLGIKGCHNLTSLPQEIRNLTSLKELRIEDCPNLTSLPQEIRNLTSLKELRIEDCPNLTSLPQEIRNLTSLKELRIYECPLLGQRCKRQIGEDWPFIAHVPRVLVDWQNQQLETISSEC